MSAIRRSASTNLVKYQAITLDNIMETLVGQAMGFHFGKPKRLEEKGLAVILPILREGEIGRDYLTFPETEGVLVTDSGIINKVNLKNTTDQRVFVRSGTVFAGKGTQSRTITRSAVLFPGKEVALDARCVHASHGIRQGSGFDYHGTISLDIERGVYGAGFTPRDQNTFWSNVQASNVLKSACMNLNMSKTSASLSDDLGAFLADSAFDPGEPVRGRSLRDRLRGNSSRRSLLPTRSNTPGMRASAAGPRPGGFAGSPIRYGRAQGSSGIPGQHIHVGAQQVRMDSFVAGDTVFTQNLDEILSKVKLHDDQVGISLITDRGVETIELYEVHKSWAALHKDSVKRMSTELIKEETEDVFEYKPEKAIEQVTRVLSQDYDANVIFEHKADGADKVVITGLTSASYIGEVVELGGKVIHLSLLKRAA